MSDDKVVPADSGVFTELMATASQLHQRASSVKTNLENLERLLNNLPGKTTAIHFYNYEYEGSVTSWDAIQFHRSGKQWILSHGSGCELHDSPVSQWTPVMECPLETKVAVLKESRGILTAIVAAQRDLLSRIDEANDDFAAWLSEVEATSKETR